MTRDRHIYIYIERGVEFPESRHRKGHNQPRFVGESGHQTNEQRVKGDLAQLGLAPTTRCSVGDSDQTPIGVGLVSDSIRRRFATENAGIIRQPTDAAGSVARIAVLYSVAQLAVLAMGLIAVAAVRP